MAGTTISFVAKWMAKIVFAELVGGTWMYVCREKFIPVSEAIKPYNINAEVNDTDARKILLGSDAVDLLSSFAGHNLDMSNFIHEPRKFAYRLFSGAGVTPIVEGDAILVLVPQM